MQHRFFSAAMLRLIAHPEHWQLVSSWFPPEIAPVDDACHLEWMADNSHLHPQLEMLVTLSGDGWQGYRGVAYPRRPGSIFFFDAYEPHDSYLPCWAPDTEQLLISFLPAHILTWIFSFRRGQIDSRYGTQFLLQPEALGLQPQAVEMLRPGTSPLPAPLLRLQLTSFIGMLLAAIAQRGYQEDTPDQMHGLQRGLVQAIMQHIRAHTGQGMTLESLAQLAGYSKYYFHRTFKRYAGMSVHAYIDQCRYEEMEVLRAGGKSQKEIAYLLGFSCPVAFAHWQKRYLSK